MNLAVQICSMLNMEPDEQIKAPSATRWGRHSGFTSVEFIDAVISSTSIAEAASILGYKKATILLVAKQQLLSRLPNRKIANILGDDSIGTGGLGTPWYLILLALVEHKRCRYCDNIKGYSCFNTDIKKSDGLNAYCRQCRTDISTKHKQHIKERTPSWAEHEKIRQIYDNCPIGYHVDHVIPLRGINVSGLHVHYNLQYLEAADNMSKSSKFDLV